MTSLDHACFFCSSLKLKIKSSSTFSVTAKKQRITLSTMHNKRTTASDEDASSEDDVDEEDRSIRGVYLSLKVLRLV